METETDLEQEATEITENDILRKTLFPLLPPVKKIQFLFPKYTGKHGEEFFTGGNGVNRDGFFRKNSVSSVGSCKSVSSIFQTRA